MKQLSVLFVTGLLLTNSTFAFAKDMSVTDIINKTNQVKDLSFSGNKSQLVVRTTLRLQSNASIDYVDQNNFNVTIKDPPGISGIKYAINSGKAIIYFPYEKLSFTDAPPSSGDMITQTVLGRITSDLSLLQKNYTITMKPDDQIASAPTYVIDIKPKTDKYDPKEASYWHTPSRTFWVNKNNFQIMREDRSWGDNYEAFFTSQFTSYKPLSYSESPNVRLKLPYNVKKVPLGEKIKDIETYMETYKTPTDYEKVTKEKLFLPGYLPVGFKLRDIQVLNFYDTNIVLQKYDDGLNTMYVSYRSKPNFFLTLLAGSFSLDLLHKMSDLSYNAPYNYITSERNNNLIISFGDIHPNELQKVNDSVNVTKSL